MRVRALLLVTTLAATVAAAAPAAPAATGGPKPIAPAEGKGFDAGTPFTFKVKSAGSGAVFIIVSTSKRKKKDGTLAKQDWFRKMARKGTVFSKKTDSYPALEDYFLNRPGTYYWQTFRIDCGPNPNDCNIESGVRRFRIR